MPKQTIQYEAADGAMFDTFEEASLHEVYGSLLFADKLGTSDVPSQRQYADVVNALHKFGWHNISSQEAGEEAPEVMRLRYHLRQCLAWMESLRASGDAGSWTWGSSDVYTLAKACEERGGKGPDQL